MKPRLTNVITFRAPDSLAGLLRSQPHMSEFIQRACSELLKKEINLVTCPKCKGSGFVGKDSK